MYSDTHKHEFRWAGTAGSENVYITTVSSPSDGEFMLFHALFNAWYFSFDFFFLTHDHFYSSNVLLWKVVRALFYERGSYILSFLKKVP